MADILTQLQTCYDQLNTQFYATICYINLRHSLVAPQDPSDPYINQRILSDPQDIDPYSDQNFPRKLQPEPAADFEEAKRELAHDLVLKEKQIESLIENLPGINATEQEQEERIRALAKELREVEKQRKQKRRETRKMIKKLEHVTMGVANGKT
ncbi:MAG: hypothetical protein Q9227_001530 [Pyrenula ochraceoflavens]